MINIHNLCKKKFFSVVLPPPNITGEMHIGHLFQYFIIDVIIKFKKIQNYKLYYFFGLDHAGISVFTKFKKKKNIIKNKNYLQKKYLKQLKFINFIILNKKIEFTINKNYEKTIIKNFFIFFKKKMIFIKKQNLNFVKKQIISDIEINNKIFFKNMYYIKYKIKKKYFITKTSNLNTIIKNTFLLSFYFIQKKIKIISPFKIKINLIINFKINKNIKLSPSDNNYDYLLFFKYNQKIIIKNYYLTFYKNNKKKILRKKKKIFFYKKNNKKNILIFLKNNNYIVCIKKYKSKKKIKKNNIVKNTILDQWYIKIKKTIYLKKIIYKINIFPNKYKKVFLIWIKNLSNWCISRQINWGTKIPLFVDNEKNIYIIKKYKFIKYFSIKNVFDTWYNSSYWILFNYKKFNKTLDIILSGYDIIFYWIIKMLIINIFFFKKILIKKIFIHNLIKDKKGRKISKSTNNYIKLDKIKKNINKIKLSLLKNIEEIKISKCIFLKKQYFLKKKNYLILLYNNVIFYKEKNKLLLFYTKYIYFKKKFFLEKNILSKKIFILLSKIYFPIKNFYNNNKWNLILNYFINKIINKNFFIIKIKNKKYLIKKKKFLNYLEIFFKIKTIIYVKYKNKTF